MADLRDRFRIAEKIPAPDLWPDIQERLGAADPDQPVTLGLVVSAGSGPSRRDAARKWLTIAAAFLIAVPAIAFAIHAIHSSGQRSSGDKQRASLFEQVHGWVAFAGSRQVIAIDPLDPSHQILLTGDGLNQPIAWSSDGSTLLVRRGPCCGKKHPLFALRSDGSEMRLTPRGQIFGASFSPDGSVVVYGYGSWKGRGGHVQSLYLVNTTGGAPTLLAKGDPNGTEYDFPAWSPDGSTIAFEAWSAEPNHASISLMRPDGTDRRVLVSASELGSGGFYGLDWSPDGSRLVFGVQTAKNRSEIWVVDSDGTGLQRLRHYGWSPSWSPDGSRIAFDTLTGQLITMSADGGGVGTIAGATPISGSWVAWNPVAAGT
ncbi:MAG: TolB family protein [Actinomycetota bacterium]